MKLNAAFGSLAATLALCALTTGCDSLIVDNAQIEAGNGDGLPGGNGDDGSGGGNGGGGGGGSEDTTANGPMVSFDFTPSSEDFLNPERGYYVGVNLLTGSASSVRTKGSSLAIALVRLDAYRDADLDAALLNGVSQGLANVRAAGVKVVLRFMYNSSFSEDASKARILGHIAQLKPILQANADVIAVMQAGFIGAWGEWHGSTNGLENNTDRKAIVDAILDALPESRTVAIRTPMYKEGIYPGGPLDEEEAFTGSNRARVGHHNDCYLASSSDMGTYASPVANWESFVSEDGRFTPVGGETCAVYAPKTDCAAAVGEMEASHLSYLNAEYNDDVLAGWDAGGCGAEIKQRLGARFALARVAHTGSVAPGGVLDIELDVTNEGFASSFNERPVFVVLRSGTTRKVARITADPRRWAAGEKTALKSQLRVPADLAPGTYSLSLWMPDAYDSLQGDARYSVRLANAGVWDAAHGENVLSQTFSIDAAAPGPVDATAGAFVEL